MLLMIFQKIKILEQNRVNHIDIDKCNEAIKNSINPKIKQKFNVVIDKINEANKPIKDHTPLLKTKSYRSVAKGMYPKSPTFTMKINAQVQV